MDLNFPLEFRKKLNPFRAQICLKTCSNYICNASDHFQKEIQNVCRRGLGSPKYAKLGHFTLLFGQQWQRNVPRFITHVHSYCYALNLLFGDVPVAVVVCLSSPIISRKATPTTEVALYLAYHLTQETIYGFGFQS